MRLPRTRILLGKRKREKSCGVINPLGNQRSVVSEREKNLIYITVKKKKIGDIFTDCQVRGGLLSRQEQKTYKNTECDVRHGIFTTVQSSKARNHTTTLSVQAGVH